MIKTHYNLISSNVSIVNIGYPDLWVKSAVQDQTVFNLMKILYVMGLSFSIKKKLKT